MPQARLELVTPGLDSKSFDGVNQDLFSKNRFPSVLPIDLNINSPSLATWTFSSYHNSFDNGGLMIREKWLWNLNVFVQKLVIPTILNHQFAQKQNNNHSFIISSASCVGFKETY